MTTSGLGNGSSSGFALGTIGVRVAVGDGVNVVVGVVVGVGVGVGVLVGVLVVDVAAVVVAVLALRGSGGGSETLAVVAGAISRVGGRFADSVKP